MPLYALRLRKASSPGASRPALPSMIASARPRKVVAWAAAPAAFGSMLPRSVRTASRSSSGLSGDPSLPTGAAPSVGLPRQVFGASAAA